MSPKLLRAAPFALLVLVKLLLAGGLPMTALPTYGYDEELFVRLAAQISAGHWLGPYTPVTLVKGAGYPIFIAAAHHLGISLSLAHQLLYAAFCVALAIALRPAISSTWKLLFIFALVLFNPASFPIDVFDNANREGIYPALTGLIFAGAIGMAIRYQQPLKRLWPWSILLGLSLGYFWITREEGMWVVPSLILILGVGAIAVLRAHLPDRIPRLIALALIPPALSLSISCAIAAANRVAYGEFVTVQFKDSAFLAAYGSLARVEAAPFIRLVPVPKETRLRIYPVSPAFRELQPWIEGDMGKKWENATADDYPRLRGEIAGGWFMWALKEAATGAGHGENAKTEHKFFAELAREVNAACDDGRLPASPRRDSLVPRWRSSYLRPTLRFIGRGFVVISSFNRIGATIAPSEGSLPDRQEYGRMIGANIAPALGETLPPRVQSTIDAKLRLIGVIVTAYQKIAEFASIAAAVLFLALCLTAALTRRASWPLLAATAMLGAIVVRVVMLGYITATSFPAINTLYLSCCYPLVLSFVALTILEAAGFFFSKSSTKRNPSSTARTAANSNG
jgi:hypothetical protein